MARSARGEIIVDLGDAWLRLIPVLYALHQDYDTDEDEAAAMELLVALESSKARLIVGLDAHDQAISELLTFSTTHLREVAKNPLEFGDELARLTTCLAAWNGGSIAAEDAKLEFMLGAPAARERAVASTGHAAHAEETA